MQRRKEGDWDWAALRPLEPHFPLVHSISTLGPIGGCYSAGLQKPPGHPPTRVRATNEAATHRVHMLPPPRSLVPAGCCEVPWAPSTPRRRPPSASVSGTAWLVSTGAPWRAPRARHPWNPVRHRSGCGDDPRARAGRRRPPLLRDLRPHRRPADARPRPGPRGIGRGRRESSETGSSQRRVRAAGPAARRSLRPQLLPRKLRHRLPANPFGRS